MEGAVAVLIDADNTSAAKIGSVLAAVESEHGPVRIKRAYGDWDRPHLSGWRHAVLAHAIRRIDAIAFASGKNCSDHVLIADAVHLALTADLSTVVLVTSDADFTDLAIRLREYGLRVCGVGDHKTPMPFIRACNGFAYIEDLGSSSVDKCSPLVRPTTAPKQAINKTATTKLSSTKNNKAKSADNSPELPPDAAKRLRQIVTQTADKDGWANLSTVCSHLHAQSDLKSTLNGQLGGKPGRYLKR